MPYVGLIFFSIVKGRVARSLSYEQRTDSRNAVFCESVMPNSVLPDH